MPINKKVMTSILIGALAAVVSAVVVRKLEKTNLI